MKEPREFIDFLEDILDSTQKIERFIKNQSYDEFAEDDQTKKETKSLANLSIFIRFQYGINMMLK